MNTPKEIKNIKFFILCFSPESYELLIQAGLLARPALVPSHLVPAATGNETVAKYTNPFYSTYSYGDSPGFAPGSLLILIYPGGTGYGTCILMMERK